MLTRCTGTTRSGPQCDNRTTGDLCAPCDVVRRRQQRADRTTCRGENLDGRACSVVARGDTRHCWTHRRHFYVVTAA